jgi:DNA-binding CsgD family transcriptional regulator
MISNEYFEKLLEQNRVMIKLLAANAIQGKSFREQIKLLSEVGLTPTEISGITGKSVNTINVTKTLMKKKK